MSSGSQPGLSTWDKMKGSVSAGINTAKAKINSKIKSDDNNNDGSVMFNPLTFTEVIFVYSPIFIAIIITSLTFVFQNWKGVIYLAFLIASCIIRDLIYRFGFPDKNGADKIGKKVCDTMTYTNYGNASFSSYVFAFTITYLSTPMFTNKANNWWLFSGLLLYFAFDIFIKYYNGCVTNGAELFINILAGIVISLIMVLSMNAGGSQKYLFFNETQSSKEQCSQPSKQTFKCDVYKDGKLVQTL